ncbi:MAG: isoprenylcysteine carboxylmethyltransferase family protein [Bacteroidales bacterium]
MALVHEFEKTGNWLFKRRSWLPVVLVVAGLSAMYYVNRQSILFKPAEELIFLGVSLFGEAIRIITVGHAPVNTSGRNTAHGQLADVVNTSGIYSLVRHPLYIGNFFMWLGPALFMRSFIFALVFFLVYWLYYERIMFAEEQFLRSKFGEAYDKWSEKVKAVLPRFKNYIPSGLPFSFRTVVRREYNSFVNIFVIFIALDLFRNYLVSETIYVTPMWAWLTGGAAVIWLVSRLIHKKTSWLTVEGR